ncbi:MAG TPA: PAS domain S-box protein, partial [Nitrospirota bacterium]
MDFIYLNLLNLLGDFSLFQVLTGAVLLLASVILTFQIKKNIPDDLRTEWRKTSNFILLFFTVYVFFILVLLGKLSYSIQPVTASLFLVSACFVYLIMMLIKTFTLKIRDKDVEIKGFIEKLKDNNESLEHEITVRRKTEERLRLYEKAVETMQIGVTIADTRGIITYTNPADALMHGFDPEELAGKDVGTYAPAGHRKPLTVERMLDIDTHKREGVNVRRDGSLFPVQLISSAVLNPDGEPIGVVTVCEDITERKQAEEKLVMYKDHLEELVRARTAELTRAFGELKSETLQRRSAEDKVTFMAYHDSLTGLPNRYSLLDMLSKMLDRARGSGRPIAAMFLDLDNFKRINDTLGHGVGDRLLQGVAERLS